MNAGAPFELAGTTIRRYLSALLSRRTSAVEVVEAYLQRIDSIDRCGPALNSVVSVNPQVVEEAGRLDRSLGATGQLAGPLHGVPVLVKDQVETGGWETTFGSVAFRGYRPEQDATIIAKLRAAGALIIAKTLLPDFGTSWFAVSSAAGEALNPYDPARDPGGSSGGTGAAVAANLGLVGIGTDTGGSIRVPAAFTGLVGLRPTTGLISRRGISPLIAVHDTAGPMTRTVRDTAILLDVLVGYDRLDPFTHVAVGRPGAGYASAAETTTGLRGARIGVLREFFGPDAEPDSAEVNRVVVGALQVMVEAGAEVVDPLAIPDLDELMRTAAGCTLSAKRDINRFLALLPGGFARRLDELHAAREYHPLLDFLEAVAQGPDEPEMDPAYQRGLATRDVLGRAVLSSMAAHQLDTIAYPTVRVQAPLKADVHSRRWSNWTFPTNTFLAPLAGLPAISVPCGLSAQGMPIGLDLLGAPLAETRLIGLAAAFEHRADVRLSPAIPSAVASSG